MLRATKVRVHGCELRTSSCCTFIVSMCTTQGTVATKCHGDRSKYETGGRRCCPADEERSPDRHGGRQADRPGRTRNLRVGGFMESYPFGTIPESDKPTEQQEAPLPAQQPSDEGVEKVRAARPTRRRTTTARKRKTTGTRKRTTAKKSTTARKRSPA